MTPERPTRAKRYNAYVAPIWQSRLRRLVALAALVAGFTQHGLVRWVLFGAFALIVAGDVAWQERDRRAGRQ
jgi:cytochrome c oxidase subunit IV